MLTDGITQAISLVMAPHYSSLSIKKYQEKIESGLKMYRGQIEFEHITSYHDAPGLIEAFAQRVQDGLDQWPEEQREDVHIVFSAHSLPERVNKMGDPYEQQLLETARLVAEKSGLSENRWSWSYQSKQGCLCQRPPEHRYSIWMRMRSATASRRFPHQSQTRCLCPRSAAGPDGRSSTLFRTLSGRCGNALCRLLD